jgi:flagellar L-ring protein precursor FlgH
MSRNLLSITAKVSWHEACKRLFNNRFLGELSMKNMLRIIPVLSLALMTACTSTPVKRDPDYAAVRPVATEQPERNDGAIFDARTHISLYEDYKARRVGDILTVNLQEATTADKESETTISKSNTSSVTNPTILGSTPEFNLPGFLPLASTNNNNLGSSLSSSTEFSGSGDSDQKNTLTGSISVSVVEVLPNGNLIVRGEKVMTLNQGNEYIRIAGIVSPRDIQADNSIPSTRIADAQISYTGDGATNDANVIGWLSRFFASALMPF